MARSGCDCSAKALRLHGYEECCYAVRPTNLIVAVSNYYRCRAIIFPEGCAVNLLVPVNVPHLEGRAIRRMRPFGTRSLTRTGRFALLAGILIASPHAASRQTPSWLAPFAPFRIAENLYYVGSRGLASYLITTNEGHILINSNLKTVWR